MKVILVNAFWPPYAPGGAEYSALALAHTLVDAGHSVVIVAPDFGEPCSIPKGAAFAPVRAPFSCEAGQTLDIQSWMKSWHFCDQFVSVARDCWRPGDVVHLQGFHVLEPGSKLLQTGVAPVILTIRDTMPLCPSGWCMMRSRERIPRCCRTWFDQVRCAWQLSVHQLGAIRGWPSPRGQLRHWMNWRRARQYRVKLNRLTRLVTVSEGFRSVLLANGVGTPENLTAVYNLPPPDWTTPTSEQVRSLQENLGLGAAQRVVLVVGKRSLGKGIALLYDAMRVVHESNSDAVAVSVGKGPTMPSSPFWVNQAPVSPQALRVYYALADIVAIPSLWPEPFSRVFLEAMASSKPIVAADVGGSAEGILHEQTGWLVKPNNAPVLGQTILNALQMPKPRLAEMGRAAHRLLWDRFAPDKSVGRLLSVYRQALSTSQAELG
jgi:glycosyltransferase involved in cell wall biosynthesis